MGVEEKEEEVAEDFISQGMERFSLYRLQAGERGGGVGKWDKLAFV